MDGEVVELLRLFLFCKYSFAEPLSSFLVAKCSLASVLFCFCGLSLYGVCVEVPPGTERGYWAVKLGAAGEGAETVVCEDEWVQDAQAEDQSSPTE